MHRVVFLRQKAEVVADRQQAFKQLLRVVFASDRDVGIGEPEAAGQESAFAWMQAVVGLGRVVALEKPIDEEVSLDCLYGAQVARILGLDEANFRQQKQAGVEQCLAVGGAEGIARRVE